MGPAVSVCLAFVLALKHHELLNVHGQEGGGSGHGRDTSLSNDHAITSAGVGTADVEIRLGNLRACAPSSSSDGRVAVSACGHVRAWRLLIGAKADAAVRCHSRLQLLHFYWCWCWCGC